MNNQGTGTVQAKSPNTVLPSSRNVQVPPQFDGGAIAPKPVGYGLPCAHCRAYYAADLKACPICKSSQRVSVQDASAAPLSETVPDPAVIEEERERFLREFKSQVYAAHTQIDAVASFRCTLEAHRHGEFEEAAVCRTCYNQLQERIDVLEAALHLDLQEATQVIYDAVWADSSDPSKTYQNAAQALLAELRRRAGISTVLGSLKPLAH